MIWEDWGAGSLTSDSQRGGLGDGVGLDSLSEGGWAWADRDISRNGCDDPGIDGLAGNWSVDGGSWSLDGSGNGSRVGSTLSIGNGVNRSSRSFSSSRGLGGIRSSIVDVVGSTNVRRERGDSWRSRRGDGELIEGNGSFVVAAATSSAAEIDTCTKSNESNYAMGEGQKPEGGKNSLNDLHFDELEDLLSEIK